jgi:hypothetical protein
MTEHPAGWGLGLYVVHAIYSRAKSIMITVHAYRNLRQCPLSIFVLHSSLHV